MRRRVGRFLQQLLLHAAIADTDDMFCGKINFMIKIFLLTQLLQLKLYLRCKGHVLILIVNCIPFGDKRETWR